MGNERQGIGSELIKKYIEVYPNPEWVLETIPGRVYSSTTPQQRSPDENKKDECSYSFLNAIKTLAMVREAGLEPARPCEH